MQYIIIISSLIKYHTTTPTITLPCYVIPPCAVASSGTYRDVVPSAVGRSLDVEFDEGQDDRTSWLDGDRPEAVRKTRIWVRKVLRHDRTSARREITATT